MWMMVCHITPSHATRAAGVPIKPASMKVYDYHGPWTLSVQTNATGADQGRLQVHGAPAVFHVTSALRR